MKNKGKAILFCRVSTTRQTHMLSAYERELREIAYADGYSDKNIEVISDTETASKKTIDKRKTIKQLKELIEQGNIAVVYCAEMSRFTRRIDDGECLFHYLKNKKVKFVTFDSRKKSKSRIEFFGKNSEETNDNYKKWIELVQFGIDEINSNRDRVNRSRRLTIEEGKHQGSTVIKGYYVDKNGHYHINENEAALIRRIYREIIVFYKHPTTIAQELIEEGYLDDSHDITTIQKNIYNWVNNINLTGKNNYPQIISENLYQCVQQREKERTLSRSLLSGILYDNNNKKYYRSGDGRYCIKYKKLVTFSQAIADKIVWDLVKEHFKEYYEYIIKPNGESLFSPFNPEDFSYKNQWRYWLTENIEKEKRKKQTWKKRVGKSFKQLNEQRNNGEITAEEYVAKYNLLQSKEAAKANEFRERKTYINRIQKLLTSIDSGPDFDSLDFDEKRVILLLCVHSVIAERERVKGKKQEFYTVLTINFKRGKSKTVKFNYREPGVVISLDKAPLPLSPPSEEK